MNGVTMMGIVIESIKTPDGARAYRIKPQ